MPKLNGAKRDYSKYKDEKGKFTKGNPGGGRPEGSFSLVEMLKRKLQEVDPKERRTYAEQFIDKFVEKGLEGSDKFMRDTLDRVDGKPHQTTDITSDGEQIKGVVVLPNKDGGTLETSEETGDSPN